MRNLNNRRFGAHEVATGRYKGTHHVGTKAHKIFFGEIVYLNDYLNRRLHPKEPEEVLVATIVLNLQSILEYELELVIANFVDANKTTENQAFLEEIFNGFKAFKVKFEWAFKRGLITDDDYNVMEQIRLIRNRQTHARPEFKRTKLQYFGKSLLTRKTIVKIFTDVNGLTQKLRRTSGSKDRWPIIPPRYAEEMGWVSVTI